MKIFFRILLALVVLPVLYLATVIALATIRDYKPESQEQISKIDDDFLLSDSATYSVLIWNIGYSGLGAGMDFFYDGGKMVRDREENVRENLQNITGFLLDNDTVDFILLQEVDLNSHRSYGIDMVDHLNMALPGYFPFFTLNYKVSFVPMPLLNPMGRVQSGLLSLSKHVPSETVRHSFSASFPWPKNLFMLDRCFLVNQFKREGGKEFLLVNTHNSAYDNGTLSVAEIEQLYGHLAEESKTEKSFLVGGDWNQSPSINVKETIREAGYIFDTLDFVINSKAFPAEGWSFHYDDRVPTNRRLMIPYNREKTPVTVIDYFLASPDIEVLSCQTIDLQFANSDHHPVLLVFRFK